MLFIWIAKNQRSKNLDSTKSVKKETREGSWECLEWSKHRLVWDKKVAICEERRF